jgi:16S rRNA (guanine527-N7)-methyltransferase
MEKEEWKKLLKEQCGIIKIDLSDSEEEKFYKYMELLRKWNENINLTAITEPNEVLQKHFIDSLTVIKYIKDCSEIIDVGTGAGFPGIPIKIVDESVNVTLLDSLNKRISFLDEVISNLNLTNINTIHARAEEAGKNAELREKFDISISRAVAPLNVLVEYLLPFAKVNGMCICMKGSNTNEEIENSKNAIKLLGGKIETIEEFTLPNSDIKRTIIIVRKVAKTPSKYPRKPGTPSKEPIK